MKIYPSKLTQKQQNIIDNYLINYCQFEDTKKIGKIEFNFEVPTHNPSDMWVHQLKGSFIEYLIAHILKSDNLFAEFYECEKSGILSDNQLNKLRFCINKINRNTDSFNIQHELLLLSMCHYYTKKSNGFNPQLFDFYCNMKNPIILTKWQINSLSQSLELYHNSCAHCDLINDNFSGQMDIFAKCNDTYHVIDVKFRSSDPKFYQLLLYAALTYSIKKVKASHIVMINPKTGNMKKYKVMNEFYNRTNDLLTELINDDMNISSKFDSKVTSKVDSKVISRVDSKVTSKVDSKVTSRVDSRVDSKVTSNVAHSPKGKRAFIKRNSAGTSNRGLLEYDNMNIIVYCVSKIAGWFGII